jgi:beta-galactosidase
VIKTARVETTGAPAKLILTADRTTLAADGRDVSVIAVSAVDARGRWVPTADNPIELEIDGAARIIGVGNGDPGSHEPDKIIGGVDTRGWKRKLFNGYAQVIVQSGKVPGRASLRAKSPSLDSAQVDMKVR